MKHIKNPNSLRSLLLSICLIACIVSLTGCGGTQSETKAERSRRWKNISRSNLGQIVDDVDAFLMMDRRSKLSKNHIRDY
jgi:hypothetical protein